ncbi:MAG: formylglycine-generating enzyme family protein [Bacteroidia bacterium]|nr:formylglycine-generating enzyme family protein [Bacteroidia bacterium]
MENDFAETKYGNFVRIPIGNFTMGNDKTYTSYFGKKRRERPQSRKAHRVKISNEFAVLETPVTVSQYKLFVTETNKTTKHIHYKYLANKFELKKWYMTDKLVNSSKPKWKETELQKLIIDQKFAAYPIVGLSYYDCLEYCEWLSVKLNSTIRLLTEAEWEYCCRANEEGVFYWGNDIRKVLENSWCCLNSELEIQEVKKLKPNNWGLYDMTGNIWEWCLCRYSQNFYKYSPLENSCCVNKNCKRFVIRGGSSFNKAETCRSTHRFGLKPEVRSEYLGFRILMELK